MRSRSEMLAELCGLEREVAAARAAQVRVLRDMSREWGRMPSEAELAATLDVSVRTARDLLETAKRTPELSDRMACLESGEWSFDRAAAVAPLVRLGADAETMASADERDIAGVRRLGAMQRRITARSEREAFEERSVRTWASLDQAAGFLSVQLTGPDWQTVTVALDRRGDQLPRDESSAAQRRADALVALAHDYLDGRTSPSGHGGGGVVSVMVDPGTFAASNGQAGATMSPGPRIGPQAIDEMLCNGSVEVLVSATSGVPLAVGPTTQVVPPKIRRLVLARDGGCCTIDGCWSTYRLEVHHIVPRSHGGTHDTDNLITLCWYHHHVEIHGRGKTIDPTSPPHRRRLIPAGRDP